jgi:signal peptidase II
MADPTNPFVPSEVEGPARAEPRDGLAGARRGVSTSLDTNGSRLLEGHRTLAFSIAAIIFAFDQITKYVVTYTLQLQRRGSMELLDFFDLRWVENRGVSMGYLTATSDLMRWLLVLFTGAIATFVAFWIWREKRRDDAVALSLVLGGALGNIVDRIRFGYVVDFADLHFGTYRPFLIFNVADAAITIGVLLLLVRALLTRPKKTSRKDI